VPYLARPFHALYVELVVCTNDTYRLLTLHLWSSSFVLYAHLVYEYTRILCVVSITTQTKMPIAYIDVDDLSIPIVVHLFVIVSIARTLVS
jgi:hypothetical protein